MSASPQTRLINSEGMDLSHRSLGTDVDAQHKPVTKTKRPPIKPPTIQDARISSLRILAVTLLKYVESLELVVANNDSGFLNLRDEVRRFEAELIRSALIRTGGRQRRAARLLGMKVTTLNMKIRRYELNVDYHSTNNTNQLDVFENLD